jgi:hypothetical protein
MTTSEIAADDEFSQHYCWRYSLSTRRCNAPYYQFLYLGQLHRVNSMYADLVPVCPSLCPSYTSRLFEVGSKIFLKRSRNQSAVMHLVWTAYKFSARIDDISYGSLKSDKPEKNVVNPDMPLSKAVHCKRQSRTCTHIGNVGHWVRAGNSREPYVRVPHVRTLRPCTYLMPLSCE